MPIKKGKGCFGDVMGEFKRGQLHSGKKGPVVKSRQQAKAIASSICMEESEYSCPGGCGGRCGCPNCNEMKNRKSNMMSLGFTEDAVDTVLFAQTSQDFSENQTAEMVVSRLGVIMARAAEAKRVIEAGMSTGAEVEFEQWAIDKITLAADYMSAAADNIHHGDAMELEMPYGENKGLWHNIHKKRERIKRGSGERMRKPGEKGAPSAEALRESQKK
jgi:hypothetical protein